MTTDGQKIARFHRESKKNQFEVCDKQTDGQTDRHSQRQKITDS